MRKDTITGFIAEVASEESFFVFFFGFYTDPFKFFSPFTKTDRLCETFFLQEIIRFGIPI